jgi:hypothetical protein
VLSGFGFATKAADCHPGIGQGSIALSTFDKIIL